MFQGEQRKVFIHNTGLLDYASNAGFEVVDTFNMTMARYKDFVQGKCACHFHKVRLIQCVFIKQTIFCKYRLFSAGVCWCMFVYCKWHSWVGELFLIFIYLLDNR